VGMYSFFETEDIEMKDFEGCKKFIKNFVVALGGKKKDKDWGGMFSKMIDNKNKSITFGDWNDIKLISYWLPQEVIFLSGIAKYIEGSVNWKFENEDESGWVEFKDGECIIHTGQMNWQEEKSSDMLHHEERVSPELKKMAVLIKLKAK